MRSEALRDFGTPLALKMEFTPQVFLSGKLPNIGVLDCFLVLNTFINKPKLVTYHGEKTR